VIAEQREYKAIFLGDYCDRGPSSMKTIKVLSEAKENHPDWIFIRGNHDQMLLDFIEERCKPEIEWILRYGTFFYSQAKLTYEEWKLLDLKEQKEVKSFLESTLLFYETEHFIFLHGVLRETAQQLESKSVEEFLWNYEYEPYWEGKPFVHGHLPIPELEFTYRGININTSCGYKDGYLTGLILEDTNINQSYIHISPNGDVL